MATYRRLTPRKRRGGRDNHLSCGITVREWHRFLRVECRKLLDTHDLCSNAVTKWRSIPPVYLFRGVGH